jgi:predicted DNA-binding helix-hairpin-helix protein
MIKKLFYLIFLLLGNTILISCNNQPSSKKNQNNNKPDEKENKSELVLNVNVILTNQPFLNFSNFILLLDGNQNDELFRKVFLPLNLNTANESDFRMIPGVGKKMAHEFVEYRPYSSIEEFKREIGKYVDDSEVFRYLNYVFVPVELNTSKESDIKNLPGIGNKMAHEFIEYRPYKNITQFRREIGKYVDEKELNRLERFVYLKEN